VPSAPWPVAAPAESARLCLEPLTVDHAPEAVTVFADPRLHTWTGGQPASLDELRARYRRQSAGQSPDGRHGWLNWMLRRTSDHRLVGTVQATLTRTTPETVEVQRYEAELAWVIGPDHQGVGYGREAARAMLQWLRAHGVDEVTAHIRPGHQASIGIARALGLRPTSTLVDGEVRWTSTPPG